MKTLTQPIKIHGGKNYLAQRIIDLMPARCLEPNKPSPADKGWLHYVEPYFGGGSVLLQMDPRGISEVANDIDGDLMQFWRALQNPSDFKKFQRKVEAIPFGHQPFFETKARLAKVSDFMDGQTDAFFQSSFDGPVEKAIAFFVCARQSLAGRREDFSPLTRNRTRRGMNEQASAWLNAIDGLADVHARLRRVVILNRLAVDVIRQQDGPRTLFYLDPPYLQTTRTAKEVYGNEMTPADHEELLKRLARIKGRFLLSGYPSSLYERYAKSHRWHVTKFLIDNKAAGGKTKRKMTECVWTNYKPCQRSK